MTTWMFSFVGTLSGEEITGQFNIHREIGYPAGDPRNGTGTVVTNVTLRKK